MTLALAGVLVAPAVADAGKRRADLTETVVTAPATAAQGASIDVSDTVRNGGKRKAKASVTYLYLSNDGRQDSSDQKVGERPVKALAKGKTSSGKTTAKLPASKGPGKYFVIACADATKKVKEKKESNNCRASGGLTISGSAKSIAINDPATVAEDASPAPLDVRFNDTDPDGTVETVASVTDPAHGVTAVLAGGTKVSYSPDANYCNTPPGSPTDNFTYKLTGGSTATVAVTVTCVDDAPVANGDTGTVLEESGLNPIAVLANDTDIDGGPKLVSSVQQAGHGTVAITGGGTGLTYSPEANYCNDDSLIPEPDQFSYELNGGSSAIVDITVACSRSHPTMATTDPTDVCNDTNTPFLLTGTGFDPDAQVVIRFPGTGTESSAGDVVVNPGGTQISGTLAADFGREGGTGVLRVKNPDNGYVDSANITFVEGTAICASL